MSVERDLHGVPKAIGPYGQPGPYKQPFYPAPIVHLGPPGGGRTFCGRSTEDVTHWATVELAEHPTGFLPNYPRCGSCLRSRGKR
jgi:hypothetical protein